jgi:TonB family protein
MNRPIRVLAMASLLASPAFAAPQADPTKARQISEIVFKNYPPRALAKGEQGAVYFVVALDKDAQPTSCQVTHGSGYPALDAETCDLIVQHATFKSARDETGRVVKSTHEGVVNWRIPGSTAAVSVAPVALTPATAPEKQICKRTVRSGTVGGVERTCMTAREWAQASQESRDWWDEQQGRKGSTNCDTTGLAAGQPGTSPYVAAAGC